jgi:hypothetical protein
MKKLLWTVVVMLAILVGTIPITYLIYGINEGYLELKSQEVKSSITWKVFLYTHIVSGGIAILIGWIQFSKKLIEKRLNWHRTIGKFYLTTSLICSISGVYIGFFATGGWIPALAFIAIACLYFYTTWMGYVNIRNKRIIQHQNMMTYSYAFCLTAVSLRICTPIAYLLGFDYVTSYSLIAWTVWIPNVVIAYWVNKSRNDFSLEILKNNF